MASVQSSVRPGRAGRGRGRGRGKLPLEISTRVGVGVEEEVKKLSLSETSNEDSGVTSDSLPSSSPVLSESPVAYDFPAESVAVQVCPRPDFGTRGRPVKLRTNHFVVEIPPNTVMCRYEVRITHLKGVKCVELGAKCNAVEKHIRQAAAYEVFKALVAGNKKEFGSIYGLVYDRSHSLYTMSKLPFDEKTFVIHGVKTPLDEGKNVEKGSDFMVKLQFLELLRLDDLTEVIVAAEKQKDFAALQVLDLISSQCLYMNDSFTQFGRSFYKEMATPVDLGNGRTLRTGFNKSHRPILGNWKDIGHLPPTNHCVVSLNINSSKTAFYLAQPVTEFLYKVTDCDFYKYELKDHHWIKFADEIRGLFVEHSYGGKLGRFAVKGVTRETAVTRKFIDSTTGKEISVQKYFADEYNIQLRYPKLCCLFYYAPAGPQGRQMRCIPIELCSIANNQRVSRKRVNEIQTSAIIKQTAIPPEKRRMEIMDVVKNDLMVRGEKSDPFLDTLGIKRSMQMLECTGRVLDPPKILYGPNNRKVQCPILPANGQWDCKFEKFLLPACCRQFGVIHIFESRSNENQPAPWQIQEVDAFLDALHFVTNSKGLQWPKTPAERVYVDARRLHELEMHFRAIIKQHSSGQNFVDIILVVNDHRNKGAYGEVKRLGENVYDVATSCVTPKTVADVAKNWCSNRNKAITTCFQFALKINAKLGGVSSELSDDNGRNHVVANYLKQPVLFMGADVTHPPPQSRYEAQLGIPPTEPSIAAIVAANNMKLSEYTTIIQVQDPRREPIDRLQEAVEECIQAFTKSSRQKPKRILFYRDGVSEGQVYEILTNEVAGIRRACKALFPDYEPAITFVNVQKRHNTRLFLNPAVEDPRARNADRNVAAGTVVDVGPVHPQRFEFFLASQQGIQGTTRPTKYTVLHDDNGFSQDDLQELTFYLCHQYVRCTKSVSLPAPVFYAHLAAERAKVLQMQIAGAEPNAPAASLSDAEVHWQEIEQKIKVLPKLNKLLYYS